MKNRDEIRPIMAKEIDAILEAFYRNQSYAIPEKKKKAPAKKAVKKTVKKKVKK